MYAALEQYLSRLRDTPQAGTRVWLDESGRAQGRFFNSTLTSAFQPVRAIGSGTLVAYEACARSYSDTDQGLNLWKLLDHAASYEESIALDRLCRMLHAINYYRQPQAAHAVDLLLSVHARLLAAVDSNHGIAFRRILDALELPHDQIVLQLPLVTPSQGWLLHYVADNYRRNGFRLAVNAANPAQARELMDRVRPDVIKVDIRDVKDEVLAVQLLAEAARRSVRVVFKRVENKASLATLERLAASANMAVHAQGFLWGAPHAALQHHDDAGQAPVAHADSPPAIFAANT